MAADQAALVLLWQVNVALFDALLAGLLVMPVGVILLGPAMRRDPASRAVVGNVSVALGVIGLAAATVTLVDPRSAASAIGVFALIGFHLVSGCKTYCLTAASPGDGPGSEPIR